MKRLIATLAFAAILILGAPSTSSAQDRPIQDHFYAVALFEFDWSLANLGVMIFLPPDAAGDRYFLDLWLSSGAVGGGSWQFPGTAPADVSASYLFSPEGFQSFDVDFRLLISALGFDYSVMSGALTDASGKRYLLMGVPAMPLQ